MHRNGYGLLILPGLRFTFIEMILCDIILFAISCPVIGTYVSWPALLQCCSCLANTPSHLHQLHAP